MRAFRRGGGIGVGKLVTPSTPIFVIPEISCLQRLHITQKFDASSRGILGSTRRRVSTNDRRGLNLTYGTMNITKSSNKINRRNIATE